AAAAAAVQRLVGGAGATVLTSSLARARQTGRHIADALGVEPVEDAEWDEQGFGDWDGASVTDLIRDHPDLLARFRNDPDYTRPGGETQTDLEARVIPALDRAVARGGTVVIATHRKPILVVLRRVLHLPSESFWTLATAPASLTAIATWADGNVSVAFTNRTDHLGG
ncbi:MAG TPA: histidine phosphatase family protein, partial [Candidatus Lustribacter sp.]|nr:histidine phosphatase family protein [Candidatus Lustribacter sp.]